MVPMRRRKWQVGTATGILTVVGYLVFSAVAFLHYPSSFSPITNWLSDLGNYSLNPAGAIMYDAGVFLTGLMIAGFSLSYLLWGSELAGKGKVLLGIGIASGLAAGGSLAATGFFPLPTPVHGTLGMLFQINMGDLIIFSTVALLRHPRYVRPIAVVAFAAAVADFNFSVLNNTPLFEWLDIGLFLTWAALMTVNFWRAFSTTRDSTFESRSTGTRA